MTFKRFAKKTAKILLYVLGFVLFIVIAGYIFINTGYGKRLVKDKIVSYLQKKLNTTVRIEAIDYGLPKWLEIKGVYVEDQHKDTLLSGEKLSVDLDMIKLISGTIYIRRVEFKNTYANFYRTANDSNFNFQFITDAFQAGDTAAAVKDTTPLNITLQKILLDRVLLNFRDDYGGNTFIARVNKLDAAIDKFQPDKLQFDIGKMNADSIDFVMTTTNTGKDTITGNEYDLLLSAKELDIRKLNVVVNDKPAGMYYTNKMQHLFITNGNFDLSGEKIVADKLHLDSSFIQFTSPKQSPGAIAASPAWSFKVNEMQLRNNQLLFDDNAVPAKEGLDLFHFDLININAGANNIFYSPDSINATIQQFSFADKSGFALDTAHAKIAYNKTGISATELFIQTPQSIIQNSVVVKYDDIRQLKTAPQNSSVAVKLNNSIIAVNDLYLLMPSLKRFMPTQKFRNSSIKLNTEMTGSLQQLNIPYLQVAGLSGTNINAKATLFNIMDSNKLAYDIVIYKANIPRSDIIKFLPDNNKLIAAAENISINTHLKGNLENVNGDIDMRSNSFQFSGKGYIQNFDKPERLKYDISIRESRIQSALINSFVPDSLLTMISLPPVITLKGTATGDMNNVQPNLQLGGSYGAASLKGSISNFKNTASANYDLQLTTNDLEVGKLLKKDSVIGKLSSAVSAKGSGFNYKTMNAELSVRVKSAGFNNYEYKNAELYATFSNGAIKSNGSINDSSIKMQYDLSADVKGNYPAAAKADIIIDTLQLNKLNFYTDTLNVATNLHLTAADLDPKKLDFYLLLDSSRINIKDRHHFLDSIVLKANAENGINTATLASPLADMSAKGSFQYDAVAQSLTQYIDRYYNITGKPVVLTSPQQIAVEGTIKKHPLINDFVQDLTYEDIQFKGSYSSGQMDSALNLNVNIPYLKYSTNTVQKAGVFVNSTSDKINGNINFTKAEFGANTLYATAINSTVSHDSLGIDALTKDEKNTDRFAIGVDIAKKGKEYNFSLRDTLLLNYKNWNVAPGNKITYSPQGILVSNFLLNSNEEKIAVLSRANVLNSPIDVSIESFRIQDITSLFNNDTLFASGIINGKFSVSEFDKKLPAFNGNVEITKLQLMQQPVGTIKMFAQKQDDNVISAGIDLSENGNDADIKGTYYLNNEQQQFDATLDIRKLSMRTVQAFSQGNLVNTSGAVSGSVTLNGKFADPRWKGSLSFDTTKFTLTTFGTTYSIDKQKMVLDHPLVSFNKFTIKDSTSHSLVIDGNIKSNTLTDYDLSLDIDANNFILVNSPKAINSQVYGFAAVNANISVTGNSTSPDIQGDLSLSDNSDVTLVLPERNANKDAALTVVRFIDRDTFALPEKKGFMPVTEKPYSNFAKFLNYNLNIEANKKSALTIVIDPTSGDELKVKGDAQLNAGVDPGGNILVAGTYELSSGYYELNYQFLKKRFNLLPGSIMSFSGNPLNAEVNITAEYIANTSAKDLLGSEVGEVDPKVSNTFNQKIPFRVLLYLKGAMIKPDISFDIQLPDENAGAINNQLRSTIENKLTQIRGDIAATNKQVFSLLLLGRFTGEQSTDFFKGSGGTGGLNDVARESVSKFLSAALDQIASDLFKGVDVDLNLNTYKDYTTGDEQQKTDLNVAVSKSFADDRLSITVGKNFGIEGQDATAKSAQQKGNTYLPDVTVNYKLSKDGKYVMRVYKKDQFEVILDGYVVETGLAFILTMDYDKFSELFRKKK